MFCVGVFDFECGVVGDGVVDVGVCVGWCGEC